MSTFSLLSRRSTPFVGREKDVERLNALLDADVSLVTIVGPPGVGKTRFAEEVLAASRSSVRCALGDARTAQAFCRTLACALGLSVSSAGRVAHLAARISDELVGRRVLFDDADALDDHARALIARWTQRDKVSVLVTAREPLHVLGEQLFPLEPLGFDTSAVRPSDRGPALDLLCALLRGTRIDVRRAEILSGLSKIAAAVDGLPLALELLAPQIASAGVDFVLARLTTRSGAVLGTGARGSNVLGDVLASAWAALGTRERRALARLSVFRGSFELSAALAILGGDASAMVDRREGASREGAKRREPDDDFGVIQALCDKSLLAPSSTSSRRPRFKLLAPLRAFAFERLLELEEQADAQTQHARFYASLSGASPDDWDDLVACVERCIASPEPEAARLAVCAWCALEPIFAASGSAVEQLELAERVAVLCERTEIPPETRARTVLLRGDARRRAGHLDDADLDFQEALRQIEPLKRSDLLGRAWRGIGVIRHVRGDIAGAEGALTSALAHLDEASDAEFRGVVLSDLGINALAAGEPERARPRFQQALDLLARAGNVLHRAGAACNLGVAYLETDELEGAQRAFEEAAMLTRGGASMVFGFALANLGLLAHLRGDLGSAFERYARALDVARDADNPRFVGTFLGYLGVVALEQRNATEANARFIEATQQLAAAGDGRYQALVLSMKAASEWWLLRDESARSDLREAWSIIPPAPDAVIEPIAALSRTLADVGLDVGISVPNQEGAPSSVESMLVTRVTMAVAREAQRRGRAGLRLRLHRDGWWFQIGHEPPVRLRSHATLSRLLSFLARAHRAKRALAKEELVEVGWPDERLLPTAAKNRLKVALSQLRRSGLGELLETVEGGYCLSASCTVDIVDDEEP